jgi:calcium permeable stress-gated cation channel
MTSFHAQRLSSRTVLFLGIPKESLSEQALRQVFGHHVRKIWIVPDCEKLEDKIEDRDDLWNKLETGEMKLIINENKKAQKQAKKKGGSANPTNPSDPLASVGKKDWPTHKLKFLIGKKVDTIQYGRTELPKFNKEIQDMQNEHFDGRGKSATAAFVEFSSQAAAQEAMQFSENKKKTKFSPRYIQVHPEQVIWKNLAMSKASRKLKMALATTVITLMTIFWAIPVAFVGSLSNVNYLTNELPWLGFINSIPDVILGVVTGLLPVVLLAVLVALVPIICRREYPIPAIEPLSNMSRTRQICRRANSSGRRIQDAELVLHLPSDPGVFDNNILLSRVLGRYTDCPESWICCQLTR